jgi:hypothetical protein
MNSLLRLGAEVLGILTILWGVMGMMSAINMLPSLQLFFLLMSVSNVLGGLILSPTCYGFISSRTGIRLSVWPRILLYLLLTAGVFWGVIVYAPFPTIG